ncbi:MAG: hypothetical protein ABTQ34_00650 [Bdellovibrionales bacterium]
MTLSIKNKNAVYRAIDFTQILILVGIFVYYFVENFVLSGSWEILALRSVDDAAMQGAVHNIHKAMTEGRYPLNKLLATFDYAYGNAYWLLTSILLFPFYLIGDAQAQIVAGRQISLLFVAGSIYVMGRIVEKLYPESRRLKYPLMIAMATAPMVAVIATKLHVNAPCIFWGVLSFYYLVRRPDFIRKDMMWSAVFAGVAVGFKLTAVFILPVIGLTLLSQIWRFSPLRKITEIAIFSGLFLVVAAASMFPPLLLFPFYGDKISEAYKAFLMFRDLAAIGGNSDLFLKLINTLGYFLSPLTLAVLSFLFLMLILDDIRKRRFVSSFIFGTILLTLGYLVLTVQKDATYVASYMLSVSLFLPLGLLGVAAFRAPESIKLTVLYLIVVSGLICMTPHQKSVFDYFNFFALAKSEKATNQMAALEEIRSLVSPLKLPVRVLQDCESVFPATMYTDGVFIGYIFGDLKDKTTWGDFDYILLSRKHYIGKPPAPLVIDKKTPLEKLSGTELEEAIRQRLYDKGDYYGRKYRLIYDRYDSLLYQLVKPAK